jgi:hypothetical protein
MRKLLTKNTNSSYFNKLFEILIFLLILLASSLFLFIIYTNTIDHNLN